MYIHMHVCACMCKHMYIYIQTRTCTCNTQRPRPPPLPHGEPRAPWTVATLALSWPGFGGGRALACPRSSGVTSPRGRRWGGLSILALEQEGRMEGAAESLPFSRLLKIRFHGFGGFRGRGLACSGSDLFCRLLKIFVFIFVYFYTGCFCIYPFLSKFYKCIIEYIIYLWLFLSLLMFYHDYLYYHLYHYLCNLSMQLLLSLFRRCYTFFFFYSELIAMLLLHV